MLAPHQPISRFRGERFEGQARKRRSRVCLKKQTVEKPRDGGAGKRIHAKSPTGTAVCLPSTKKYD
jgi:hypothetical protein